MIVHPDKTLKIEETFKFLREVSENPIITISGYALNQKDDGESSKVSYAIRKK